MTFQELTHARYSLRKFSDRPVEEEKLELVLKAAQSAPTAHNAQPQRILVLRSAEAREKPHNCTPSHVGEPVLLVISCNEEASWHRDVDGKAHGEIDAAIATTQMMLQAAGIHDAYFALTQVVGPDLAALTRAPDAPPPPEDAQERQTDHEMSDVALLRLDGKLEALLPQQQLATSPATNAPPPHGPSDGSVGATQ